MLDFSENVALYTTLYIWIRALTDFICCNEYQSFLQITPQSNKLDNQKLRWLMTTYENFALSDLSSNL